MPRKRANGEGSILKRTIPRKDGTSYVRWVAKVTTGFDENGEQLFTFGPRRAKQSDAKADLERLTQEASSTYLRAEATQTVEQYMNAWLKSRETTNKYRGYETHESTTRCHIIPRIGHIRLNKLTKLDVQNMCNNIYRDARTKKQKGEGTTRKARATLSTAYQDAIDLNILPNRQNVTKGVKVPSEQRKQMDLWTDEEAKKFFKVAKESRLYPIIHFALATGMREGEICALRWQNIEYLEHKGKNLVKVNVEKSLVRVRKRLQYLADMKDMEKLTGYFYLDTPKTRSSQAHVLAGQDTYDLLQKQKEDLKTRRRKMGEKWQEFNLVFPSLVGTPTSPDNLLDDFYTLITKAGVKRIKFHALRDTHASRLLAAGHDIAVVSARLRHSRKSTTLDRYVSSLEEKRLEGAVDLSELFDI